MFDMMPMIRNRNIFSGQPDQPETTPFNNVLFDGDSTDTSRTSTTTPDKNPFGDAYSRIVGADSGPAQQKFRNVLDTAPRREDFQPNKKQRLASMLTGIAAGSQGRNGYEAARGVLDEPFNRAQGDFAQRANIAKLGADEEEKSINNRRQLYRDILSDQEKSRNEDRLERSTNSTIDLNNARKNNLLGPKAPQNSYLDKTTGHRMAVQPDPSNPQGYKILDLGKADETPTESDSRLVNRFRQTSSITAGNQKSVFDYEEPRRQTNRLAAQEHANTLTIDRQTRRMDRQKAEKEEADAANPNRQFARRTMAFIDVMDEHPDLADKIEKDPDTGLYQTSDEQVREYVRAKLKSKSSKPSDRIVK
jgi:hypothetical protein